MQKIFEGWIERYFADEEAVILLLLVVLALVMVATIGHILAPFIAAAIFAFLLQGSVVRLTRLGVPRLLSVTITFLLFVGLLVSFFVLLLPLVIRQATNFLNQAPGIISSLQTQFLALPEKYPQIISSGAADELMRLITRETSDFAESSLGYLVSSLPGFMVLLVYLILVPFLVFFMLKDKGELLGGIGSFFPNHRPVLVKIWNEMNIQLANYVRGKFIEILLVGGVSYVTFVLLDVDYAALLALLAGLSVIIPYVGVTVVTIPIALVGFFQWGWSSEFMWLMVAYGVIQTLDGNVLVPILFSEAVNLHPVVIILAVLFFGGVWGIWGVFFAIPLATLVKVIYNAWPRRTDKEELPAVSDVPVE